MRRIQCGRESERYKIVRPILMKRYCLQVKRCLLHFSTYLTSNHIFSSFVFTSWIFNCQLSTGLLMFFIMNDFIVPTAGPSVNVKSSVACVSVSAADERLADVNTYTSVAWILSGCRPLVKIGSRSFRLLSESTLSVAPAGGCVALYHSL